MAVTWKRGAPKNKRPWRTAPAVATSSQNTSCERVREECAKFLHSTPPFGAAPICPAVTT
jgi:hypothetical protein